LQIQTIKIIFIMNDEKDEIRNKFLEYQDRIDSILNNLSSENLDEIKEKIREESINFRNDVIETEE